MREYPKKARTDAPTGLSHWGKSGRDSRSGYGKQPNADMQPMNSAGGRSYPKGKSEFQFGKSSKPYERVQKFDLGGAAGPDPDTPGSNYESPTAGMPDSMQADMTGGSTNNYGADNYGADYGGGGVGVSTWQNVPGYSYEGVADAPGYPSGSTGEPGFSGSAGSVLENAVGSVRGTMQAPNPTTDAYGRAYSPLAFENPTRAHTLPESIVGPPVSLDKPLPSYTYAQGKFGYAITTPNTPKDPRMLDYLVDQAIEKGIPPEDFVRIGFRESTFKANSKNGIYQGLYQMSPDKVKEHRIDPMDYKANAAAAAKDMSKWSKEFEAKYGRAPTRGELYLSHQQGETGISRLVNNPNQNAIEARKSENAILGNVDDDKYDEAKNWTSQQFIDYWNGNLK